MRVVIANPPWPIKGNYGVRATSRWPHLRRDKVIPFPVFHAYAAAVFENANIEVLPIDAVEREWDIEKFGSEIYRLNPDFVFIETSVPSYRYDRKTIETLGTKTKAAIVVFGPQASAQAEFLLKDCREIDIAVRGEYDYALLEITQAKTLQQVLGITFRDGNRLVSTPTRPLIENLDELPFPARHLYPGNAYQEPIYRKPNFLLSTSRGCSYGCSFCLWPQTMYGRKFRIRSAKSIIDEIKSVISNYGAKSINFDDDTFTLNKKRIFELCDEIIANKLKFHWYCYSSTNIDDPLLYRRMKEAGCEMVKFGVETADNQVLSQANKHLTVEQIKKGFRIAKEAGLKTFGTFTFCLPGETKDTIKTTVDLSKELNPFAVQYSYIVPFPGTRLYEEVKDKINEEVLYSGFAGSQKPALVPGGMSEQELVDLISKSHREFYLRPRYILEMLLTVDSFTDFRRLISGFFSFFKRFIF